MYAKSLHLLDNDHDVSIQDEPKGVRQAQPPSAELKDIHVVSADVGPLLRTVDVGKRQ